MWQQILEYHKDQWEIRLRPAANLIGYFLFPVGWHWKEFKALTDADKTPYEKSARERSNQEFPLKRVLLKPAVTRRRSARDYRKEIVTRHLEKILVRGDVRYFYGTSRHLALPKLGVERVTRPLTRADFEDIRITHSTVGHMVSRQINITLDANDLIKNLIVEFETRGAKSKYNFLKIERWCRDHLERNTPVLESARNLRTPLIKAACDWQGETNIDPAGPDQLRPLVDKLLQEYSAEE